MVQIHPQHISLDGLLSKRLFRIPEYQRAYSWESKHRRELFDDIRKSYGAGNAKNHFMATVVGLRRDKRLIVTDEHQVIEVVDGQQRITTLILLLKAIEEALDDSDQTEARVKSDLHDTLVKPDKATPLLLQTNQDTSGYFSNYIRTGKFPDSKVALTLADRQLLTAMKQCETFVSEWIADGLSLLTLVGHLKNRLTFIFHEIGDESIVYSVFEVLNSRGLEVSWFDRLKSMLMSVVFEAVTGNSDELIRQVHDIWANIYRAVGLRLGLSTESLRFAATLRSPHRPSRSLSADDAVSTLMAQSQDPSKVMDTSNWLLDVTKRVDELSGDPRLSAVTEIAHARLVAVAVKLHSELNETERNAVLSTWEKVTFRIYGIHRRDARTAVGDYVRLAWDIHNENLSADKIIAALSDLGKYYPCRVEDVRKELGERPAYGEDATFSPEELRYFFRRYEEHLSREADEDLDNKQWRKIWESGVASTIEHILPQSTDAPHVHWLGNLTLLPPGLNSKLQDKSPRVKATSYKETRLLGARNVADSIKKMKKHSKWSKNNITQREWELFKWAAKEWAD